MVIPCELPHASPLGELSRHSGEPRYLRADGADRAHAGDASPDLGMAGAAAEVTVHTVAKA